MKKLVKVFLIAIILVGLMFPQICEAIDTCAKAAVVMDVNTGRVLYEKNQNIKLPMASTTKIMTTLVAIEYGRLDDIVKVSRNASYTEGSSIYLKEGEEITVEELLYGIMLRSGNDASVAVAEHVGGSVEEFAILMTEKAKEIGAESTSFANPHGLDNSNHFTTARDLALITSYALKNPTFKQIVSTKRKTITGPPTESWDRTLVNKNKMLWQYEGGDGVKTGYTSKAGRCLVSSATKDEWQLVCVVLNCRPMWDESTALLNYGFDTYDNYKVVDKTVVYDKVDVVKGKKSVVAVIPTNDYKIPLKSDEIDKVVLVPEYENSNIAPIKKGVSVGKLNILIDEKKLGSVSLVYDNSVESNDPKYYFNRIIKMLVNTQ